MVVVVVVAKVLAGRHMLTGYMHSQLPVDWEASYCHAVAAEHTSKGLWAALWAGVCVRVCVCVCV